MKLLLILTLRKLYQLSILICLFTLVACTSKSHLENQTILTLNNNLALLQNWKLKGKIAWITPQERKSAYMNWQQNKQNMRFNLSNLVGINLASLQFNGNIAILNANGEQYTDPSPSQLIFNTTGWNVPLVPLSAWVKGSSLAYFNKQHSPQILRYENGLIKQIKSNCPTCEQWIIDYKRYDKVTISNIEYQLPTQMTMYNPLYQATIKIVVSEWSA